MMSDAPEIIYLQWIPGYPRIDADDEVTWCVDEINDDDIVYIKKEVADGRLELLRLAHIALKAHNPWSELVGELARELKSD